MSVQYIDICSTLNLIMRIKFVLKEYARILWLQHSLQQLLVKSNHYATFILRASLSLFCFFFSFYFFSTFLILNDCYSSVILALHSVVFIWMKMPQDILEKEEFKFET